MLNAIYDIGEKVVISCEGHNIDDGPGINADMLRAQGTIGQIKHVHPRKGGFDYTVVSLAGHGCWSYKESWLKPVGGSIKIVSIRRVDK